MADQAFGLSEAGLHRTAETNRRVLGRLPDVGRRTRRVFPGGASGTSAEIINFSVDAWCADDALTLGCDCVYATVMQVVCGSLVQVGDQITVYDPRLCWFNLPIQLLLDRRGMAVWMESTFSAYPGDVGYCLNAPTEGQCLWVVQTLDCCQEEVYGSPP